VAAALLSKVRTELTSRQAQIVDLLKRQCPGFAEMRKLVLGFRTILRAGKPATLHRWMEQARKTGIHSLVRFVRTLKQDLQAVESAVSTPWSNGPPAQREESSPEDICAVLAAVMAHGCDLGVYTMAQLNTRRPARQRLGTGSCRI
jgi:hypothetical protein